MKLLGNRVHLKPVGQKKISAGGILYVQTYQDDQMQYDVLAVGPGRNLKGGTIVPPPVKPGDRVLAGLYFEHVTLPDGTKICDAEHLLAAWSD